ncbi:MAG TPA: MltA domain-containing protein [Albitalea sp.]|nr:MltA domain-containing protein [Albitalea sp.]
MACSTETPLPPQATVPAVAATPAPTAMPKGAPIVLPRSRWIPVEWSDLPGWDGDPLSELWPALMRSCERPSAAWLRACTLARQAAPAGDAAVRAWLQQHLQPYRVEAPDGAVEGLATGYFEPLVQASRVARGAFRVPLYMAPADLAARKPYWTRQQVDTLSAAQSQLRGRELAFVADPLDALILQIQGSGRLQITEPDGSRKLVRAAFAGHNDQPYKSVGRWLIEQGELKPEQASWPAIKAWARMNPQRLNELLWSNPRVVFFREEPLPDANLGPRGAQGVPLTPGRSIAVDTQSIPYGTPVWLDTTEPLSATPLRRAVMAQDTGSAIVGAVRADFFWGWGEQAELQAGRMKQPLRLWALWPHP